MVLRILKGIAIVLMAAAGVSFAGDWLTFSLRHEPTSQITVSNFVSAPLKNNKEEIDYLGSEVVTCSISLYPQAGHDPCWYLSRHKNRVTSY